MYFRPAGYEIVPEMVTPNEFAARTPLDRSIEKGWRTGAAVARPPRSIASAAR